MTSDPFTLPPFNYAALSPAHHLLRVLIDEVRYGVGALVAGAYWNARGLSRHALRDDVTRVTEGINGGRNGLEDRRHLLGITKRRLGLR